MIKLRPRFDFRVFVIIAAIFTCLLSMPGKPVTAVEDKQVLILIGPQYGLPIAEEITPAIVNRLQEGGLSLDYIYVEYLDIHRVDDQQHRINLLNMLNHKLKDKNLQIIIAVNQGAVDFVANEGKDLFPEAPLLIPIFEKLPDWAGTPRPLITLKSQQDAENTLKHALALFPATQQVVLISGKDDHRAPFLQPIKTALAALSSELIVEETSTLTHQEMLQYLSTLPTGTIAFYGSYFEDVTGKSFIPAEVAAEVAEAASIPVFAFRDMHILQGLAGGSVVITSELGQQTADIALEYLAGNKENIEPNTSIEVKNTPLYNWQLLKRFDADPYKLPANTVFFNHTPSLWDEYKEIIVTASILFITLLILSIFLSIRNRQLGSARRELQLYSNELDEMVAKRTIQLEAANRELDAFTYSAAHDLRGPLNRMNGFSQALLEDYAEQLDQQGKDYLQRIFKSSLRMGELIDDLLKLSKVSQHQISHDPVELSTLVSVYLKELQAKEPGRQLETAVAPGLVAKADTALVRIALENLLNNAWKFSSGKDISRIEFGSTVQKGKEVLYIRDNGAGFDMKHADKLFTAFQRLHSEQEFSGTGIGLSIVSRIIKRHGGEIWAEGEVGKGACFFFTLPG